jgi:hypothetical protein
VHSGDTAASAVWALMPVVARAIDLGRGPPALVRWLAGGLGRGHDPRELASRLARVLRAGGEGTRQAHLADTVAGWDSEMSGSTCP